MVTIGFYPDGRPGEVFTHGAKSGSTFSTRYLADACVVVSCLIQHGVDPRELATSMGRLGNAEPASIIGAVVDLVAAAATPDTERPRRQAHDRRTDAPTRCQHHRRAGRRLWRSGEIDDGGRGALVDDARPSDDTGAGRAVHDRSQACAPPERSQIPGLGLPTSPAMPPLLQEVNR